MIQICLETELTFELVRILLTTSLLLETERSYTTLSAVFSYKRNNSCTSCFYSKSGYFQNGGFIWKSVLHVCIYQNKIN